MESFKLLRTGRTINAPVQLAMNMVVVSLAVQLYCSSKNAAYARKPPKGPNQFKFYIHNTVYNPAVNNSVFDSVYSPGPANFSQPNPYNYGVRSTFEDSITTGSSRNSTRIGVAQGITVFASQSEYTLFHIFTATINAGKHQGTISIMGQVREAVQDRILTVVGGTGDFLAARGVALCKLFTIDRTPPSKWTLSFELDLYY